MCSSYGQCRKCVYGSIFSEIITAYFQSPGKYFIPLLFKKQCQPKSIASDFPWKRASIYRVRCENIPFPYAVFTQTLTRCSFISPRVSPCLLSHDVLWVKALIGAALNDPRCVFPVTRLVSLWSQRTVSASSLVSRRDQAVEPSWAEPCGLPQPPQWSEVTIKADFGDQ